MGQEIVYCSECGARLLAADFAKGQAVRHENRVLCSRCSPQKIRSTADLKDARPPEPPTLPASPPRRTAASSTRLPAEPSKGLPWAAWAVVGALAGALVLAGLLALSDGGRPDPRPEPPKSARQDPPPTPPPIALQRPPVRPSPPEKTEDARAVERDMADALAKQKRERFTSYLEEIRRKIDGDPALQKRPEIERMLDVADLEAEGRRAEVVQLRAEYARRVEEASRNTSLLGHWPLDEGSGGVAKDASGRGHDGKIVSGAPTWVEGRLGAALRCGEQDDHVVLPATPVLSSVQEGSYSLALWFKPDGIPSEGMRFGLFIKPGHHLGLSYSSEQQFHMDHWIDKGNAGARTTGAGYPPGRFYAVAAVVDREQGRTRLYVDGTLAASRIWAAGSTAHAYGKAAWHIGLAPTSNPRFRWTTRGAIDDVRIYDRALSEPEVAELARPPSR